MCDEQAQGQALPMGKLAAPINQEKVVAPRDSLNVYIRKLQNGYIIEIMETVHGQFIEKRFIATDNGHLLKVLMTELN